MTKVQIFQNFAPHIHYRIYELLFQYGVLDGVKFPGTGVQEKQHHEFALLVKHFGILVDNHGWNGITGQLHDPNFAATINSFSGLHEYLNLPGALCYSGHIGARPQQLPAGDISQEVFDYFLYQNLFEIRQLFVSHTGHVPFILGEGVFPDSYDLRTVMPSFLNSCLKSHGMKNGLDGLVLDICHANITCDYITNMTPNNPYTYYGDYLKELDCSAVQIIHQSGKTRAFTPKCEQDFTKSSSLDPHVPCTMEDWENLILTLDKCSHTFRVSNEIAYSSTNGMPVFPDDYCKEAILTWVATESRDIELVKKVAHSLTYLHTSCDNLEQILEDCQKLRF